jgi:hypothetical protein
MGIVYKSWRMIPLTILPNLFPLLIVAGIMGFTGIPLKVSTSIIFNIAFGVLVLIDPSREAFPAANIIAVSGEYFFCRVSISKKYNSLNFSYGIKLK